MAAVTRAILDVILYILATTFTVVKVYFRYGHVVVNCKLSHVRVLVTFSEIVDHMVRKGREIRCRITRCAWLRYGWTNTRSISMVKNQTCEEGIMEMLAEG